MPSHTGVKRKMKTKKFRGGGLAPAKAGKLLEDNGSLSDAQKGLFGLVRGGGTPSRLRRRQKGGPVNAKDGGLVIVIGDKPKKGAASGRRGKK